MRGINASLEIIQRTRGGGWPTEAVSADFPFKKAYYSNIEIPDAPGA